MRTKFIAVAALALSAAPAAAQQDMSGVEIKVERLAPGVAVLFGEGGNIGLSYGEDGNVLVDDQFAPLTDKIAAAVATLDPNPIRFVINTHWHFAHTGGNENFGKHGAVIVAHDNVRQRMSTDQVLKTLDMKFPPSPRQALPVVTFTQGVALHLNNDTLHVVHVANAHTDGDALVHWQKGNVLHLGDTFFHRVSFPFIDQDSGGSIDGLIAAAHQALKLPTARRGSSPATAPSQRGRIWSPIATCWSISAPRSRRESRRRGRWRRSRHKAGGALRNAGRLHQAGRIREGGL